MKTIIINSNKYGIKEVLLDDEDFEMVNQFKWGILKNKNSTNFYCVRIIAKSSKNKTRIYIRLHRFIMSENNPKVFIDHKNRNGLDCQKNNMRRCTHEENNKNRTCSKNSTSIFLGVHELQSKYKNKIYKYWVSKITNNSKTTYLGSFPFTKNGEISAAKTYDAKAKELHKEFANLNFK